MTKVVAICQARMGSTRLPGKVLLPLYDFTDRGYGQVGPALGFVTWAADDAGVDQVIVATSTLPQDDKIAEWCNVNGLDCFRGSETDVLSRFHEAAQKYDADVIV